MDAQRLRRDYDRATETLEAPLAITDLDAFDRNAAALVRRAAGKPIRIASKSVRCRTLLQRALACDGFAGVMAYSLAEAIWLCRSGISEDILLGYPSVDRAALRELARDETARAHITLMIDSPEHLDLTDRLLGTGHPALRVCLELDASWRPIGGRDLLHVGSRRSPVFNPSQAGRLAEQVRDRAGFELVGVMAYEGQIAGLGDAPAGRPWRAAAVRFVQRRSIAELRGRRAAAVARVRSVAELEFVNGGGTG
ncbi:MAG: alanine racemase, partial [Sciscionella sp.]